MSKLSGHKVVQAEQCSLVQVANQQGFSSIFIILCITGTALKLLGKGNHVLVTLFHQTEANLKVGSIVTQFIL